MGRSFISTDFLLSELLRFYAEFSKIPTSRDLVSSNGYPSWSTYRNHFGSLGKALEKAELPVNTYRVRPKSYENKELVNYLLEYKEEFGSFPTYSDLNKKGIFVYYPHVRTYEKRFGSYDKAIQVAVEMSLTGDTTNINRVVKNNVRVEVPVRAQANQELTFTIEEIDHIIESLHQVYCVVCQGIRNKLIKKRKEL